MVSPRVTLLLSILSLVALASTAGAVHFYRGPGSGCTPNDGALSDDGGASGPAGATVRMMHNTFHDVATGTPVTRIAVGESVTWTWNSEHCHSAVATTFNSGFHHPAAEPTTPAVAPGTFHYPVPTLEPTLSFTHTFDQAGTFQYWCEHHTTIGMRGVIVVE